MLGEKAMNKCSPMIFNWQKNYSPVVAKQAELETYTQALSITTFRYVPVDLKSNSDEVEEYINQLNTELLTRIQSSGQAYISNAVINEKFLLRACIVNFRTSLTDIQALPEIVITLGRELDKTMRPEGLKT